MVTSEGNSVMDVKEMLELKEIKKMDIQKLLDPSSRSGPCTPRRS